MTALAPNRTSSDALILPANAGISAPKAVFLALTSVAPSLGLSHSKPKTRYRDDAAVLLLKLSLDCGVGEATETIKKH